MTFTAPSFGQVHTRRAEGGTDHPCHPGRLGDLCGHGRRRACWHRHGEHDPDLGTPLCPDCYDYQHAVVWNALAPQLWKQATIAIGRALARRAGLTAKACKRLVKPEFAKVAEYQARGAIHYHAIIRLDAAPPADDPGRVAPPPAWATVELLADAVRQAAATVTVPGPTIGSRTLRIGWGVQVDLREIATTTSSVQAGEVSAGQVAGYVAKYATKATEGLGAALDQPIRTLEQLDDLTGRVPEHIARLARACWDLGARPELAGLHLRRWTHMLGYGGHFTTKSRRYSTTFTALRRARVEHARQRGGSGLDAWGRPLDPAKVVALGSWQYAGRGYRNPPDAWLARSLGEEAREMRRIAREEVGALAS